MRTIYCFDVDGTLTPSREKIHPDFEEFFLDFCKKNEVYLITGSDKEKTTQQLSSNILNETLGLFSCSGNQFWIKNKLIYENKFTLPDDIENYLKEILKNDDYPYRAGNHIEKRPGMVNFSIVGRNCSQKQRKDYYRYDLANSNNSRKIYASKMKKIFPTIDFVIGGEISIDIYPKGKDKSQAIRKIRELTKGQYKIIFFGDRLEKGGNDYPAMKELTDIDLSYNVNSWKDTKRILENGRYKTR